MNTLQKYMLFLLFCLPFTFWGQTNVSGVVTDNAMGQPIPGVNVIIKGTSTGTSTDFDGNYNITANNGDILVFSYIGFVTKEVQVTGKTLNVTLLEDTQQLDEVVVIGYGTVKKQDATSAVTTVTTKDFNKGPLVSAEQLIQGKVAGIQVTNSGGSPGEGALIRIRSGSSLNANNDPLYVIDGVPVDAGGGGVVGGRNPLATINQNDIESINILKDAAATAIYGSRASNGVVIITTKKGKSGDLKVNYNSNVSVSQIRNTVDVLNASQYNTFVNNYGSQSQIDLLGDANTNWQDEIYRTAIGTDHNISLNGGQDNVVYRASAGYTNMNGILDRDNFERITLSAGIKGSFFDDHLKVELNSKTANVNNNYSEKGAIGAAVTFDPTQQIYAANDFGGYFQWLNTNGTREVNANINPLSLLNQKNNYGSSFRSIGNVKLDYKLHFLPELTLTANLGYDIVTGKSWGNTAEDYIVLGEQGSEYTNNQENKNKVMDLYFNYKKYIDAISTSVDFTAGYNYQDFRYFYGSNYYNISNGFVENPNSNERVNLQSYFGRATFSIADKYIVMGSFRRDGSSRFTEENRWGNFPAASVAWKMTQENFLKNSETINELKLRASWGITGQQDIGKRYPSVALYSVATETAGYQIGYDATGSPVFVTPYRPEPYNPNLVWEQTETLNLGVDFGLFDSRLTGAVDVYKRTTTDLIVFTTNPQGVGFSNADFYNIGDLENEGVEISANYDVARSDDFNWSIGANTTFQKSRITKLTLVDDPNYSGIPTGGISGGTGNTVQNHQVGYSPSAFYVYEQAYDASGAPIEGVYIDRNGDGVINNNDLYRYKKPAADVYYGFYTNLNYKKWDFTMNWRGSIGNYNYNNVYSNLGNRNTGLPTNGAYLTNLSTNVLTTNFEAPQFLSDYYIQDASFLKLDNVTVGYTFNDVFAKGSSLRLTGAVQNVLTITNYDGIDPEVAGGIDNNLYPRPRMYTLGVNVNF